jgi:hypothetical protein
VAHFLHGGDRAVAHSGDAVRYPRGRVFAGDPLGLDQEAQCRFQLVVAGRECVELL